jgi:hypothetical protein
MVLVALKLSDGETHIFEFNSVEDAEDFAEDATRIDEGLEYAITVPPV